MFFLFLYEYFFCNYCEVIYDIKVEINGFFEVIVIIGGVVGGIIGFFMKGFGFGWNKVRVK